MWIVGGALENGISGVMRKQFLFSLFLLAGFLAVPVLAQKMGVGNPDFSGTWELFESKIASPLFGYEPEKTAEDRDKKIIWKFVIQHSDPVIKVTQIRITETTNPGTKEVTKSEKSFPVQTFYTDGRGETNIDKDNVSYSSVSKWDGDEMRTELIGKRIADSKYKESAQTNWKLLKNGKELRIFIASSKTQHFFGADQHIINTDPFGRTDLYKLVIK